MLEIFATLASLWLVAKSVGWAVNAPNRALGSVNNLAGARLEQAYQKAALLLSKAQVELADAPDTAQTRKLNFELQRAYDLAKSRNPGAFEMMGNIFRNAQQLKAGACPNCGKEYGKGRPYCQYCGFHRQP